MGTFRYTALKSNGEKVSGNLEAGDRGEALRILARQGMRPMKLEGESGKVAKVQGSRKPKSQKKSGKSQGRESARADGIRLKKAEVILFTEELSDMLAAGLQLEPALKSMENRQQTGNLQQVSEQVRSLVRDGTAFSKSLGMVSPSFGPLYMSMAAAGEASGALDTILRRQAHHLKMLGDIQNKVILAMIYPAFLILAAIGVSFVFVTVLIPQLTTLLDTVPGASMPVGVEIMVGVTDFLKQWWWIFLSIIVIAGIAFKAWTEVDANKPEWDRMKLNLLLVGAVNRDRFYVQFLETMSNLVGNGLTLLRALELTRNATQNLHLKDKLSGVIDQVGDGRSLSASLTRSGEFPALLVDMVVVGEQTGQIDVALGKAAERYDKELNNSLQRIMALLMPVVLVLIACLVGMMVYLLLTAIFQTIQTLG